MGNHVHMWYMLPMPWINWTYRILNRHSDSVLVHVPADREGVDRRPWMISVTVVLSSGINPGYIQSYEHGFIGVNRYTSVDMTFAQVWERTFLEMFQNCLQLAHRAHPTSGRRLRSQWSMLADPRWPRKHCA